MVGSVRSNTVVRHRHNIHLEIQVLFVECDAVRCVVVVGMSEEVFVQSLGPEKSAKIHKHCCKNFQSHYFVVVAVIICCCYCWLVGLKTWRMRLAFLALLQKI